MLPQGGDPLLTLEYLVNASTEQDKLDVILQDEPDFPYRPEPIRLVTSTTTANLSSQTSRLEGHLHTFVGYGTAYSQSKDLHQYIKECDSVLRSVEVYFDQFKDELARVSSNIEHLQARSLLLNKQLNTRSKVKSEFSPVVERLIIHPGTVRTLSNGVFDHGWYRALRDMEANDVHRVTASGDETVTYAADSQSTLQDRITERAVERIRDHLILQIKSLRSPNVDAQVIQKSALLPYKKAFSLLAMKQPQLSDDLRRAYSATLTWYYLSHFSRYQDALRRLNLGSGLESGAFVPDRMNGGNGLTVSLQDFYSLGRRADILRGRNPEAFRYLLTSTRGSLHTVEEPFYAYNLALVENASFEYTFLLELFGKSPSQPSNSQFDRIFAPTLRSAEEFMKYLISGSADALGVLLCIRSLQLLAFELQRRKLPSLDGYINGTNMLLWPRFQSIIDSHCNDIRKATSTISGRPIVTTLLLSSSSSSQTDTSPHPLTQRFANFVRGILVLSTEGGDYEPLGASLSRLQNVFAAYIQRFGKTIADAKGRTRFLYNNYSLICTILGDLEGRLADELLSVWRTLRDASQQ